MLREPTGLYFDKPVPKGGETPNKPEINKNVYAEKTITYLEEKGIELTDETREALESINEEEIKDLKTQRNERCYKSEQSPWSTQELENMEESQLLGLMCEKLLRDRDYNFQSYQPSPIDQLLEEIAKHNQSQEDKDNKEKLVIDLKAANLESANLILINLQYSNLSLANLEKTDLIEAQLQKVNLMYANLKEAELQQTNLEGARMTGINATKTNLTNANLDNSIVNASNLTEADFTGATLQKTELKWANLNGTIFKGANLRNANLSYTKLESDKPNDPKPPNFEDANLTAAIIKKAKLPDINLTKEAKIPGIKLTNAILFGTKLERSQLPKAILNGAKLEGTSLERSQLPEATLQKAILFNVSLLKTNLQEANLEEVTITDCNLSSTDLQKANLKKAKLLDSKAENANLTGANLEQTTFQNVDLTGENLAEAILTNAILENVTLTRAILPETIAQAKRMENIVTDHTILWNANTTPEKLQKDKSVYLTGNLPEVRTERDSPSLDLEGHDNWKEVTKNDDKGIEYTYYTATFENQDQNDGTLAHVICEIRDDELVPIYHFYSRSDGGWNDYKDVQINANLSNQDKGDFEWDKGDFVRKKLLEDLEGTELLAKLSKEVEKAIKEGDLKKLNKKYLPNLREAVKELLENHQNTEWTKNDYALAVIYYVIQKPNLINLNSELQKALLDSLPPKLYKRSQALIDPWIRENPKLLEPLLNKILDEEELTEIMLQEPYSIVEWLQIHWESIWGNPKYQALQESTTRNTLVRALTKRFKEVDEDKKYELVEHIVDNLSQNNEFIEYSILVIQGGFEKEEIINLCLTLIESKGRKYRRIIKELLPDVETVTLTKTQKDRINGIESGLSRKIFRKYQTKN